MGAANIAGRQSLETLGLGKPTDAVELNASGVSWAAVAAGAFVAAALSLVLLSLGAGLGLSSLSPWSNSGLSASTVGGAAIVWLIVNEVISSAMGGYLAGRLRTKWAGIHTDEVYFRDTAHGFLVWSASVVMTVAFLSAASASMVGNEVGRGSQAGSQLNSEMAGSNQYFIDTLFRSELPAKEDARSRAEAGRIIAHSLLQGDMNAADKSYLAQLVAVSTGLSPVDSQNRVTAVVADTRQALDKARKASAHLLLWIFLALLIGAFSASLAATIGGRQRDQVENI